LLAAINRGDRDAGPRAPHDVRGGDGSVRDRILAVRGVADTSQLRERYLREIARLESEVARSEKKLANEGFIAKAAAEVVSGERAKLDEYRRELARTRDALGALA